MSESSPAGPGRLAPEEARRITVRITTLSVSVAATLALIKLAAWLLSGSVAMLASLADSGLDLAASLTTLMAVRFAAKPADAEHRFGHGKAEAFASLIQAVLVALSAAYLIYESVSRFLRPQPLEASTTAIAVMAVSLVLTLGLVWMQTRALKQTGSVAVTGDRAHYVSDIAANLAVAAGLVLAGPLGLVRADPAVGLLVALWLLHAAWEVATGAYDHLMDRELPDAERERILALAADDPRVLGVHGLRTRASGPFVHIQFHVDLDPEQSLASAHEILVDAERRVMKAYPAADILIHPDPKGRAEAHGNRYFDTGEAPAPKA